MNADNFNRDNGLSDELLVQHEIVFKWIHTSKNIIFGLIAIIEYLISMSYGYN
jgi:hypothetical protein